jgi:hypothetical protein
MFYHDYKQYKYTKILGKGNIGIVYLYESIAVKVLIREESFIFLFKESLIMKDLSKTIILRKYLV